MAQPQSIVDVLDLRVAVQKAARLNYVFATRSVPGAPAYEDLDVTHRRQIENAMLPLVCATAIEVGKAAYEMGWTNGDIDASAAHEHALASGTAFDLEANGTIDPFADAINPFDPGA